MSDNFIRVEADALNDLKNALATAGESYKNSLARLTLLIEEITSGDIKGDPANDILTKYEDKKPTFEKLAATIDEAEGYMGMQTTNFENMLNNLRGSTK